MGSWKFQLSTSSGSQIISLRKNSGNEKKPIFDQEAMFRHLEIFKWVKWKPCFHFPLQSSHKFKQGVLTE